MNTTKCAKESFAFFAPSFASFAVKVQRACELGLRSVYTN